EIGSALLCDINEELILTYLVIQRDVDKLLEYLQRYKKSYLKLDTEKQKEFYYELRTNYNLQRFNIDYKKYSENWIPRAAQLIFMNKTCYNGLFRMNSKGEFNSPVGRYKNPKIFDEENLQKISELLQMAEVCKLHFADIKSKARKSSFVYFDPPYRPLNRTASFTSYSTFQFNDPQQIELANLFKALDKKQAKLMLSNSDPKNEDPNDNFFDELYEDYHLYRIKANRMINSKKDKRGKINEILVLNYDVEAA
ncbi:Dam family site-specific DNA-(adenine-N6)-methyltransferase, partial [candidate division KSB1 bacterium]|nr:Dam family site-specific DNA-(adenine-N6)-methyltransferase [candidate division KSB1 bacterium]